MHQHICEYIWIDGKKPVAALRSKGRVVFSKDDELQLAEIPLWNFDGSSTYQAEGEDSDCLLKPIFYTKDPLRGLSSYLVLCEVLNADGSAHKTNTRHLLADALESPEAKEAYPWAGFEQEYVLMEKGTPLAFNQGNTLEPQGPYYCGVGSSLAFGREIVEEHAQACLEAELAYFGFNGEVMPSQWEFQIGYRGNPHEETGILRMADHLWVARWLLQKIAEGYGVDVSFDSKPVKGDWNGSGLHTNYSTAQTRDPKKGLEFINTYIKRLEVKHNEHITYYGHKLEERLTGQHETCNVSEFKYGTAQRNASIRIPRSVVLAGCGYLEDRRPSANADPYLIGYKMVQTTLES